MSEVVDYRCDSCKRVTRTMKIDEGDTPMFCRCPLSKGRAKCGGVMRSAFGKTLDGNGATPMVWVKPTLADREQASPERRAEYEAGRLILKTEAEAVGL
jgi:hypothetical protein